jgi:hypothetical protein
MVRIQVAAAITVFLFLAFGSGARAETPSLAGPKRDQPQSEAKPIAPGKTSLTPQGSQPSPAKAQSSTTHSPPPAEPARASDKLRQRYTQALGDILKGIYEGDYTRFSRNLSEQMRAAQSRQSFLELQTKVQKNLGKLSSMEYLGCYSQGASTMILFKAKFKKDKDDVLITLVTDREAAEPKVTGLWLDSPALEK